MLGGVLPFSPTNERLRVRNIITGTFNYDTRHFGNVPNLARDLINHMIVVDPNARYSIEQVMSHPWMPQKTPLETEIYSHIDLPDYDSETAD